jgi:alpha/beta hydrolase family protein
MLMRGIGLIAGLLLALCVSAEARVMRIEVLRREPFAAGQAFGDVGAYEKVSGRFHGELDPAQPLNAEIVDIDKAPRNAGGMVEYAADFYILKPVDMTKGNGALLYDVNNRGNKRALIQFNSAPASNDPTTAEQAGNGFLMRNGFTVVWSGWIPGQPAIDNALQIGVPIARGGDAPIEQQVWDEFLFNDRTTLRARLSFPATGTDTKEAKLEVRERNSDAPTVIAADQWEFVDTRTIRLLPEGTPFRIGAIYQLIYRAANPPVAGIGFAATRDLVSFLRYQAADARGEPNPLAAAGRPAVDRALAHGSSQSGRYLRDFLYRGFNEDEGNRRVFDGMNPHVAAARLFLDFRFAQPNRMIQIGHGFMFFPDVSFPFAYQTETDPFTGTRDGILARCAARNNCPKIIHTTSSTEYWQSGGSLVTTDPTGARDGAIPDNVRIYHFAGTQHGGRASMPEGVCAMPYNKTDYTPLLRALLLGLDRWVKDGTAPPPSRYPRLADRTLAEMAAPTPGIPGFTMTKGPNPRLRFDYGPDFSRGVVSRILPAVLPDSYRVLVPKVDPDGNEVSGVLLPEIAVPTGTATGWSVRSPDAGGAGELCYLDGSFVPFARTKAEREASGDPRPSLEERYRDHDDYATRIVNAAIALEHDGYVLPEDVQRLSKRAETATW